MQFKTYNIKRDRMFKSIRKKVLPIIKKLIILFVPGFILALLLFVAINAAMEPVSTSEYCGTKCHEMNTVYQTWQLSAHGTNEYGLRAECVDCHLPSKEKYFTHLIAKGLAGAKDAYKHYITKDYDEEKAREIVTTHFKNEMCLHCHKDLLAKPDNETAFEVHTQVLHPEDDTEFKCIDCHEGIAHDRESKLFKP